MSQKHFLLAALCASILSLAGCSGLGAGAYNNEKSIASDVNSYNLNNVTQSNEGDTFSAQVEKMEGMDTIWDCSADAALETELSYDITLYSGKVKLALISPDEEVTTLVELDSEKGADDSSASPQDISAEGSSAAAAQNGPAGDSSLSATGTVSFTLQPGENRIKVVAGEDTGFDMSLTVPEGEFGSLGF